MRRKLILLLAIIIIAAVAFFSIPVAEQGAYVEVNGNRVNVEIADNFQERAQGLMNRELLPENAGMLFIFESEGNYPFWMMNMRFNLDMIWIDSDGRVVYVAKSVLPCAASCKAIDPNINAKYVLEVDAGFANKYEVVEGSFVRIVLPKP